ncbi:hypothetical protein B0H21DRAFT_753448 [Amylocystis lapponica]|nr:hypothetical protein B0H21DRAFT_753448 [Amylocystis lapponica]
MTSHLQRGVSYIPVGEDVKPFYRDADAILEEGYLVQWTGVNPDTGVAWEPSWVSKRDCSQELVAKWRAESAGRSDIVPPSRTVKREVSEAPSTSLYAASRTPSLVPAPAATLKRPSSSIQAEYEDIQVLGGKRQRRDSTISDAVTGTATVGTNGLLSKPPPQLFIPKPKRSAIKHTLKPAGAQQASTSSWASEPTIARNILKKPFELNAEWLLHPAVSSKSGMLVVIQGTSGSGEDPSWFGGDHEGAHGVVLSVFSTGNSSFASTARVRMLDPVDPSTAVLTIPVQYLWPVEPDELGQNALVLDGEARGEVAKIREEESAGWFVSVGRSQHFVISADKLVRVLDVDKDGNVLRR